MPHYYFDVFDGRSLSEDEFGDTFLDADEAMDQAAGLLLDVARDFVSTDRMEDLGVVVRDERGADLYWAALMFRAARVDPSNSRHLRMPAPPSTLADPVQGARQAKRAVDEAWRRFLDGLADVSLTMSETRALMQQIETKAVGPG